MSAERNLIAEDWRILSLSAIKVEPERLQTRASLDMSLVHKYLDAMRGNEKRSLPPAAFPPVLVAELINGELWLVDGFHRYQARWKLWKEKRCEHNIRAVVRRMTMEEAVLAGIAANQQDVNAKRLTRNDMEHAIKLMIRDPELRTWSNAELARRAACSQSVVARLRLSLRDEEGIALPGSVKMFTGTGKPTGTTRKYNTPHNNVPSLYKEKGKNRHVACFGGKRFYLSPDEAEAKKQVAEIAAAHDVSKVSLRSVEGFSKWLRVRGILATGVQADFVWLGGLRAGNSVLLPVPEMDLDSVLREIGRGVVIRKAIHDVDRVILVGYRDQSSRGASKFLGLVDRPPDPIEFMTPEEVAAAAHAGQFGLQCKEGESAV